MVTVVEILDLPLPETITIGITLQVEGVLYIHHRLPPHPYVNGGWDDPDVADIVEAYLITLEVE